MKVMKNLFAVILLCGIMFVIPNSEAQTQGGGGGGDEKCIDHTIVAVVGAVNAGTFETCLTYPREVAATNSVWVMEARLMGPVITSVGTATIAVAFIGGSPQGCTAAAGTPTSNSVGGILYSQAYGMTMTSRQCSGTLEYRITLSIAPTTLFLTQMVFNVHAMDQVSTVLSGQLAQLNYQCMASDTTPNAFNPATNTCQPLAILDYQCHASESTPNGFNPNTDTCNTQANLNYQCHASRTTVNAFNPNTDTCNTQTNLNFQCAATGGTPNAFNGNTNTCTTAQVDNLMRLCANSTFGSVCNIPHLTNLNFLCAASNTNESALDGTVCTTPTINMMVTIPGGLNVTVTSWPQLQALINFTNALNITSSCGNTNVTPCYENTNANFSIGNSTINVTSSPDYRATQAYTQALWTLLLFLLAIAMAEWKKDLFYHLIAVIIGIYGIVTIPDVLGVERMVILGIMVYQIMRIYRIYRTPRNDLQRPDVDSDI